MNEPISKYMQVGLIHFMAYPAAMKDDSLVWETVKRIAVDEYFHAIEITHINDAGIRRRVKGLLETARMTVAYGAQPQLLGAGLNINDVDEGGRQRAVAFLKEQMDEAVEMGSVGFAFLSGKFQPDKMEEAYWALVKSTDELCDYAKTKGSIRVIHEIFDDQVDKKSLIGPVALAKRYAEEITSKYDNFGLMVDLSHLPLIGEMAAEAILPIRDYIVHAHMGNCVVRDPALPAYGDMHPRFGFPGGENDVDELAAFLRVLWEIGFLNEKQPPIVSFEVKPFGGEDPDAVVANAKRTLNLAWNLV